MMLTIPTPIPLGGYFLITLPSEVSISQGNVECSFVDPPTWTMNCNATAQTLRANPNQNLSA